MKTKVWLVTRHSFFVLDGLDYAYAFDPSSALLFSDYSKALSSLKDMLYDEWDCNPGYVIENHIKTDGYVSLVPPDGQSRTVFRLTENALI